MDLCIENGLANRTIEYYDQDLIAKIPSLPEGKTKHFFVSYTSLDKERVYSVIEEVERRFGLQCVFDERDFQGGMDIAINIREGMMKSLKVLLFLTPDFLESGWCKYETDAAFVSSMGCGYSCIVPVLLEECHIPPTLITLTYIDATVPGVDVPAKIASSLLPSSTDDGLFTLNLGTLNRQYENGYCFTIEATRDNLSVLRPAKYLFTIESNLIERLNENRVEIDEKLLKKTIDIANKDSIMSSYDYLSRLKNFAWAFLFVPLYVLIVFTAKSAWVIDTAKRGREPKLLHFSIELFMVMIMPLTFVFLQIMIYFLPTCCCWNNRSRYLRTKLWREIGKECIERNVLLLFTDKRNRKPSVSF